MSERQAIYLTNLQLSDLFLAVQLKQLAGFEDTDQPSVEDILIGLALLDTPERIMDAIIVISEAAKRLKKAATSSQKTARTPRTTGG